VIEGKRTSEEGVARELSNIETYNPRFNAFITVFSGDPGLSLSRARELDGRLAKRRSGGAPPLLGVPVTIKDNVFLAGFPTTDGSRSFRKFLPPGNARVVDLLLGAGCVPLGKTNLHELALGVTGTSGYGGPIHNPTDPSRVSGGSSGGSAVSVALSKGPIISIGSDTGGSVRIPAALCGVCGFKPSQGLLSTDGVFPLSPTLDHLGLLTKTVPDMSFAFQALTGVPLTRKTKPRLGIPTRYFTEDMDETVSRSSGEFEVKDVHTGGDYDRYSKARAVITVRESSWFYEQVLRSPKLRRAMHQDVLSLMDGGLKTGMLEYMRSMGLRGDAVREAPRLLSGIDALIVPTCLITAPRIDEVLGNETGKIRRLLLRNTELFNMSGLPAMSLPLGKTGASKPTALQIVGDHGKDGLVLSVAEKIWALLHGT
jgi:aspartyl-tRNA(Asn)/glutamyl-tRNA(Gln) amidotransferase subunit A